MRYTNLHHLTNEVVSAILDDEYDHPTDPNEIPCHALIAPTRITTLYKRHQEEIVKDISEDIWALLGTAVHYILSKQDNSKALIEKRLKVPFNGWIVTGKPDYFVPEEEHLKDIKITSVWKVVYGPKEGFVEWTQQLNVYAWLLRKLGYTVKKLTITAILRDWQKRESYNNADYPDIQIQDIDIKLWSFKEQEEFISGKLSALTKSDKLSDEELVLCTPKERWASETTFALMKKGQKRAVRVFNNEKEAAQYKVQASVQDDTMYLQERKGKDKRCMDYCDVAPFCSYWKEQQNV